MISKNIFLNVEPVRHIRKNGSALTKIEQTDFISMLENCPLKHLFLFYLYTGVRRNEALFLKWSDIDYDNDLLKIAGTKTVGSNRVIPLSLEVKEILAETPLKNKVYIFPYKPDYVTHYFKKLCPTHKLHDLRHTFCTRCAQSGVSLKMAQYWLGHASIETTSQIYTHISDDFQRQEAAKFNLNPWDNKITQKDTQKTEFTEND